jgi:hypothetical protein
MRKSGKLNQLLTIFTPAPNVRLTEVVFILGEVAAQEADHPIRFVRHDRPRNNP